MPVRRALLTVVLLQPGAGFLGVTAAADDLPTALGRCYESLEKIHWPGMQFRRDIGRSAAT